MAIFSRKDDLGSTLDTSQHALFCSNVEAHREPQVHFLPDYGFFCPLQLPLPRPAPRKWALLLTRLMPANLSKKKTACHFLRKQQNKIWKVLPSGEAPLRPFPSTSLGTEPEPEPGVSPASKTELTLLPEQPCTNSANARESGARNASH